LSGGQRNENFSYPDEQYLYFIAAKEFGWTPNELDEQPAVIVDWLVAIATAHSEAEAERIDKAKR